MPPGSRGDDRAEGRELMKCLSYHLPLLLEQRPGIRPAAGRALCPRHPDREQPFTWKPEIRRRRPAEADRQQAGQIDDRRDHDQLTDEQHLTNPCGPDLDVADDVPSKQHQR
jgi:hypothetical protein